MNINLLRREQSSILEVIEKMDSIIHKNKVIDIMTAKYIELYLSELIKKTENHFYNMDLQLLPELFVVNTSNIQVILTAKSIFSSNKEWVRRTVPFGLKWGIHEIVDHSDEFRVEFSLIVYKLKYNLVMEENFFSMLTSKSNLMENSSNGFNDKANLYSIMIN